MNHVRAPKRQLPPILRRAAAARLAGRIAAGALLAAPTLAVPVAAHAQAAQTRAYDIPAGTLEDTLGRFGRETGIVLSFKPEVTAGLQSNGLRGSYGVRGGLDALLAGTGIRVLPQSNGSYVLDRPAGAGIATTQLPAVTVTASAADPALPAPFAGGQVARGGGLGVLGTADVMDVPFSTTNYTAEMLENQQARTLADVVINESSVRTLTSSGGFADEFQIRGYTVSSGDVGLNGLYGLASASRMPAAIMERVEVLKGPGTLMNGIGPSGSIGGGINIVTKRAGDEPLTRLTTTYQSQSQLGGQLDMGRRYGENNEWGIRFNGVYRNGDTTIDDGRQEQGVGALALDYRGQKLRWSLDAYTQHEDVDNFRPQIGFQPTVTSLPSPPSGHRNFFPGTKLKLDDSTVATRLEYDINDHLMVYGATGYRYGTAEQTFPSGPADALGNFRVTNAYYDSYSRTWTGDVGLRARFDTWGVKHTLTLAATRLDQEAGNAYVTSSTSVPSNIFRPAPLPPVTADRGAPQKASKTELSSYTLTDTLSFADDSLMITGGLRNQRVALDNYSTTTGARTNSYDESAISPVAGVVFKPISNVSLYGNFTSGLTRGGIAPATAVNAGQVFAPYKSKQYEAGVKVDWGKVITSASVFQITRPNSMTDPSTNIYSFDGEQRNRGLELSAFGEAMPGLRMMASATFYDATLTRTTGGVNDGNEANGVPKNTFNLGVDWDTPWVRGLSLNARVIHTSSMYFNAANTLTLPSWTRYDIGARYSTEILGRAVVFRANVENLFNKDYWLASGSYATVAAPRTVLLSAQIDF
ncbi:TonB-dependent receptor [Achromobacter sp. Root83]|uniref:TonB-dependent receptor n=1 Tax=Achromobacter sp. Root83 TaxID=1736602 RepID=UPI000A684B98|nr:TonB-dependent receptor [Achromobacter sp. Root83]